MPVYFLRGNLSSEKLNLVENRVRQVIPELVTISSIEDISRPPAGNERRYVLLVAPAGERSYFDRLVDIASRFQELFFILISDEISASDYKRLVRTGAADWVSTQGAPQEILDIVSRQQQRVPAPARGAVGPVVVSFVPSAGGVGNTTLAIEVGVYLKSLKGTRSRNICCIDLDFQNSHICDYLDIEPRLQIQEITEHPERLDAQLFSVFVSQHASGLDVIAAPRSKRDACGIPIDALDTLFEMITSRYNLLLVDLPVTWFPWSAPVIGNSDAAIITGINTIPCLRQIVANLEAVRGIKRDSAPLAVAINRCKRGLFGGFARRKHVEAVLGKEKLFYIGEDPAALESVNTGQPMISSAAKGKTKVELAALALFCTELKSLAPAEAPET
jgi:pilus assembly protein CpaE